MLPDARADEPCGPARRPPAGRRPPIAAPGRRRRAGRSRAAARRGGGDRGPRRAGRGPAPAATGRASSPTGPRAGPGRRRRADPGVARSPTSSPYAARRQRSWRWKDRIDHTRLYASFRVAAGAGRPRWSSSNRGPWKWSTMAAGSYTRRQPCWAAHWAAMISKCTWAPEPRMAAGRASASRRNDMFTPLRTCTATAGPIPRWCWPVWFPQRVMRPTRCDGTSGSVAGGCTTSRPPTAPTPASS